VWSGLNGDGWRLRQEDFNITGLAGCDGRYFSEETGTDLSEETVAWYPCARLHGVIYRTLLTPWSRVLLVMLTGL
jgi:hypothetical protein